MMLGGLNTLGDRQTHTLGVKMTVLLWGRYGLGVVEIERRSHAGNNCAVHGVFRNSFKD